MSTKAHWEGVYATKPTDGVSWFQAHATRSRRLIEETGLPAPAAVIDVGGGASVLVDDLLDRGYSNVTVLDLSAAALAAAQRRLGERAAPVRWLEADVTKAELPPQAFDLWHDRAVFHFLTAAADRRAYVAAVLRALKPGGHVVMAAFAEDGPTQCSGLPVVRYTPGSLLAEFEDAFTLQRHESEAHPTPFGTVQQFVYCHFQRAPSP